MEQKTIYTKKNFEKKKFISSTHTREIYVQSTFDTALMDKLYIEANVIRECSLDDCLWETCTIDDLVFDRCFMPYAAFSKNCTIKRLRAYETVMDEVLFSDAKISQSKFEGLLSANKLSFVDVEFDGVAFIECNLKGAIFHNCTLKNMVFNGVSLEYAHFAKCKFENCTFVNTPMDGCLLVACEGFEGNNNNFIRCRPHCARLKDEKAGERAIEKLVEPIENLINYTYFLNPTTTPRSSRFYLKDINATNKTTKEKNDLLRAGGSALPKDDVQSKSLTCGWTEDSWTGRKVYTPETGWTSKKTSHQGAWTNRAFGNTVSHQAFSDKAHIFFSPGLKEKLNANVAVG